MPEAQPQFPLGLRAEAVVLVTPEVTARQLGSGASSVFATPEMVRLMEQAAAAAAAPRLQPGQQTVGTMVNVRHLAATPEGATVTARAELVAVEGRRLLFEVSAHDGTETIGAGTHERAVIDLARFEARAAAKRAAGRGPAAAPTGL